MMSSQVLSSHSLSGALIKRFNAARETLRTHYTAILDQVLTLPTSYGKAFNDNFVPAWYHNKSRFFQFKKPIALHLYNYAANAKSLILQQTESDSLLVHINQFIQYVQFSSEENNKCDPVRFLDYYLNKNAGGELGAHLTQIQNPIRQLFNEYSQLIAEYKKECAERIKFVSLVIAMIRERRVLIQKMPELHDSELFFKEAQLLLSERMKQNKKELVDEQLLHFVDEKVVQYLSKINPLMACKTLHEIDDELTVLEKECEQILDDTKLLRFELFIPEWMNQIKIKSLSNGSQNQYLLNKYLLSDFTEQIAIKEKEYLWHVMLRANSSGFKINKEDHHSKTKYSILTPHSFLGALINCYSTDDLLDLFKNDSLITYFTNESVPSDEISWKKYEKDLSDHLDDETMPLNQILNTYRQGKHKREYYNLFHSTEIVNSWGLMYQYDECNWKQFLTKYFHSDVKSLSQKMTAWLHHEPSDEESASYQGQLFFKVQHALQVLQMPKIKETNHENTISMTILGR